MVPAQHVGPNTQRNYQGINSCAREYARNHVINVIEGVVLPVFRATEGTVEGV